MGVNCQGLQLNFHLAVKFSKYEVFIEADSEAKLITKNKFSSGV